MSEDKYRIESSDSELKFYFHSEGPKGVIRKMIKYEAFDHTNKVFNLSFGDIDNAGEIDDTITSDNKDVKRIISTVAFLEKNGGCFIYIIGSTKSRTRLYRMAISNYFHAIGNDFIIYGFILNSWEKFMNDRDYEAFF